MKQIDVIFFKRAQKLEKHVYLTSIYRCDQGVSSVISLADVVLDQFKKDEPQVTSLFTKSDNASCYHGNYCAESLYSLCKSKNIKLLRYDYNEPSRGKDQCDRQSAGSKTLIRSFVDAGNDVTRAEHIHQALHYGSGMKKTKSGVAKLEDFNITGPKIPNISNYHSIVFNEDHMVMWRYYNVGVGVTHKYANLSIKPRAEMLVPFSNTDSAPISKEKKIKPRDDRQLCKLLFCAEEGCTETFLNKADFELHMLKGQHSIAKLSSSFDKVRKMFVDKMRASSETRSYTNILTEDLILIENPTTDHSFYSTVFAQKGWALPERSRFRYSNKQKTILYKYFMDGQNYGKKMSPEEAHQSMRKVVQPEEYVTAQQIRSLFSRWSRQQKEGKLVAPSEDDDHLENDDSLDEEEDPDFEAAEYMNDLMEATCSAVPQWKMNDWVAVVYDKNWYPGEITDLQENHVVVNCMRHSSEYKPNYFCWPTGKADVLEYFYSDILCKIDPPDPANSCGYRQSFIMNEKDFELACEILEQFSKKK